MRPHPSPLVASVLLLAVLPAAGGDTKLVPEGTPAGAAFGSAVAVQGNVAVIGAPRELDAGGTRQAGAVYVRTTDGPAAWRLTPGDAAARYQFGRAVDVDGNVLVVGAGYAAYVFRFDEPSGQWLEEARLEQDCSEGRFGSAVAVSGERILVGSPLKGCLDASVEGYVFFYRRASDGTWELEGRRTAHYGTVGSYYGSSVSLEGDTAVVGAPGWGEVFTYRHDGSTWQTGARIVDPNWGSGRQFGASVSLQGGRLVVGTPGDGLVRPGAGAAYAYLQTATGWTNEVMLLPPPTSPGQKLDGTYYGTSVALSHDLLVLGGPQADVAGEQDGAVLVYGLQNGSWTYRTRLTATDTGSYAWLGAAVDIDKGAVLAGAPRKNASGGITNVGAAYLFTIVNEPPIDQPPAETNLVPRASFTFTTDGLNAHFDAGGSSDPDGTIVSYAWTFGDLSGGSGVTVSRTYAAPGYYTVYLRVTDNGGKVHSLSQIVPISDGSGIVLSARGNTFQGGLHKALLTWSNAASPQIDIYRDNVRIATVPNHGRYEDDIDLRGRGTYRYRVCEAGTGECSNEATVVFAGDETEPEPDDGPGPVLRTRREGGRIQLELTGAAGETYEIQATTDLTQPWAHWGNLTPPASLEAETSSVTVDIPFNEMESPRFFRAIRR